MKKFYTYKSKVSERTLYSLTNKEIADFTRTGEIMLSPRFCMYRLRQYRGQEGIFSPVQPL